MRRWLKAILPTLAVLLPALALALLGLRSYQAEQVLAENRFQSSLRSLVDLTASGLEEAAHAAIRELADLARAGNPSDVAVERVRSRHPIVGQVFLLGRQGEFLYPALSRRPPPPPPAPITFVEQPRTPQAGARLYQLVAVYHRRLKRELEARQLLARAKREELTGHLAAARQSFRAVVERSARLAPPAWLGLGRVSFVLGRWLEAAQAYAVLVERYPAQQDWAGVSYGLIGRLGLLMVATRCRGGDPGGAGTGAAVPSPRAGAGPPGRARPSASPSAPRPRPPRPAAAILAKASPRPPARCPQGLPPPSAEALRLYTDLVYDRLRTDPQRRIFYIDWVRARITMPRDAEGKRRLEELDASVALLRVGMRFATELGREGARRLVQRGGLRPRALREDGFRRGEALFVVQAVSSQVVGFVLNQAELVSQLQRQQGRRRLPEGYVPTLRRLPLSPPAGPAPTQVRPLDEVLGDLGLVIYGPRRHRGGPFAEGVLEYLGVVGALVLVLLAGLFTTWRSVRHETELARLKSEFVSNVSHELKTPLTSIRMFGEMLQQELQPDQAQRRKYYNIIVAESDRLGRLINNVLDFSRMDRGTKTYTVEPHNLAELAREAVETFRHFREVEEFTVALTVEAEPEVQVDRDAVVQSVLNLLTNAVKYSGTGRQVRVRVLARGAGASGAVPQDEGEHRGGGRQKPAVVFPGGDAVVAVSDDGIGVPRGDQRRIFEDFYRASNAPKGQEGTGLGLALVRRHTESLGGRVELESELGQGSTFRIVFPRAG